MNRLSRWLPFLLVLTLVAVAFLTVPTGARGTPQTTVRSPATTVAQADADDDDDEGQGGEDPTEDEVRTSPKALDPREEDDRELPAKYLLSPLPPVINQRNLNSCGACSFGYAMTSFLVNKANGTDPSDPANQVSPAFMYHIALVDNKASDCSYTRAANYFDFLVRNGAASCQQAPYPQGQRLDCSQIIGVDTSVKPDFKKFRLGSWDQLEDAHDLDDIKGYLCDDQPVVGLFEVYKGMHRVKKDVYVPSGAKGGRHFMTIVGYDDTIEYTDHDGGEHKGAFRVMNSWGTQYGDNGFLWIGYDAFPTICNYAWTAEAVENKDADASGGDVTPSGDVSGKITKAYQAARDKHVDLIFAYQFSEPVVLGSIKVTTPGKGLYGGAWDHYT